MSPYFAIAIDRAFARLTALYGREFTGKFDGTTPEAVKAAWAHELRFFARRPEAITWALDHLPERCPNAVAFRKIAEQAPRPEQTPAINTAPVRGPNEAEREALRRLSTIFKTDRAARGGSDE